ncbi:MAG: hypothetical protein GWN73_29950, partial [Actinobacteria bacterium]|nr:hypothetical protein [Actinomycetota bacterium]NIS34629.1 hypothetical protein [Actinomycetota bacterium]NIT97635.1 hypothetical protein [Actinomycetota bacterium]NIU69389.1 hypothetical protein [Actinomycetota bacterium]NIW31254.1 hypothetical protein [Actinomycetota bacterium]
FSEHHRTAASYERLGRGRVQVARNIPETDLPAVDDWTPDPIGSRSWRLFYHSLAWLLGYAWAIENGIDPEANLAHIRERVFSHIAHNVESGPGDPLAWDDHATADRLAMLVWLHCTLLAPELGREERDRLIAAIDAHLERITGFRDDGRWISSNHGAFHALAALDVGLALPDHPVGRRGRVLGESYLRDVVNALVDGEEGVAVEQSTAYHTIDISLLRSIRPVVEDNDLDLGVDLADLCARMVEFNHVIRGLGDRRPSIGDTPFDDAVPAIGLAATDGEPETPRTRWIRTAGAEGEPVDDLVLYPRTGLAVLRRGEPPGGGTVTRAVVSLHGKRILHGHFDQLSVTFQVDEHRALVDSGGPYAYGDPLRFGYFVAARAHNVVMIDGLDHQGASVLLGSGHSGTVSWVIGSHDGHPGLDVTRAVIVVDDDTLVVVDQVVDPGSDRHSFTSLWHLHPSAT